MALELQLPLGSLRPVRIRELKESALCLSYDKRGIHFLVDRFEGNVKAILLNGEHAFHSFEAESANNWKGLALTGFEIVVDLDSAMDTENEWPPLGAISLGSNGVELRVTTSNHYGITDDMDLKLGIEGPVLTPGLQVSFSRWAFRVGEKDRPQFLWIEAKTHRQ